MTLEKAKELTTKEEEMITNRAVPEQGIGAGATITPNYVDADKEILHGYDPSGYEVSIPIDYLSEK